jgi:hypothetical protein
MPTNDRQRPGSRVGSRCGVEVTESLVTDRVSARISQASRVVRRSDHEDGVLRLAEGQLQTIA